MHHLEKRCAERTAQVVLPLGPIETLTCDGSSLTAELLDIDADIEEALHPNRAHPRAIAVFNEETLLEKRRIEQHACFACEMVITAASKAQITAGWRRGGAMGFWQVELIDLLEPARHLFRSNVEEAASAGRSDDHQAGVDQVAEVFACRRWGKADPTGEFAGSVLSTGGESCENVRSIRVSHCRANNTHS